MLRGLLFSETREYSAAFGHLYMSGYFRENENCVKVYFSLII